MTLSEYATLPHWNRQDKAATAGIIGVKFQFAAHPVGKLMRKVKPQAQPLRERVKFDEVTEDMFTFSLGNSRAIVFYGKHNAVGVTLQQQPDGVAIGKLLGIEKQFT